MKAIVKDGVFVPQEPLPEDWAEGTELEVEKVPNDADKEAIEKWYAELEASCSQRDPEDDRILKEAIREIRMEGKERAQKEKRLDPWESYTFWTPTALFKRETLTDFTGI